MLNFLNICKKPPRFIFALRISVFLHYAEFPEYMQKTAALYFCTPDL